MTHLIYTRACYEGCALIAWTQVRLLCWWMTSWNKHSSKPTTLPPRDYMYSPKGTFIFFLSVWSLTIRFVCTHSYIILHYILLRQTGRWGNFCVVEEESHSCSFTYMYLAQASTGRPLSPEGKKNRFISRATFVTWQKWGEHTYIHNMYARGLRHIHIQTVGVGKFETYVRHLQRTVSTPLQLTDIYI